ncbi:TPA: hypothetical protein ACJMCP_001748 [Neisseria meningitidis]
MIICYITLHRNEKLGKTKNPSAVIPAKAGIQTFRGGNLSDKTVSPASWIPTFVGMTGYRFPYGRVQITACAGRTEFQIVVFDFLFCGNNGILDDVHLSGKLKTLRRHSRESGNLEFQCRKNLSGMSGV